jgi:hypothetical protein
MAAETEADARTCIVEWAVTSGADVQWLAAAQVREIEIVPGTLLAFVML